MAYPGYGAPGGYPQQQGYGAPQPGYGAPGAYPPQGVSYIGLGGVRMVVFITTYSIKLNT